MRKVMRYISIDVFVACFAVWLLCYYSWCGADRADKRSGGCGARMCILFRWATRTQVSPFESGWMIDVTPLQLGRSRRGGKRKTRP